MVSCESLTVAVYNEGANGGRGFILYTGQHYDPLVSPAVDAVPASAKGADVGAVAMEAAGQAYAATSSTTEVRCLPTTDGADWDSVNKAALQMAKVTPMLLL